jgi:CheY-like chemotaxis protein
VLTYSRYPPTRNEKRAVASVWPRFRIGLILGLEATGAWMTRDADSCSVAGTVLVVDDEPDIRFLLRVTLELAGYSVIEAAHGEAALERVRVSPPVLVITDRMMPRMGGGELIERLRADLGTAAIPIVMLTGTSGSQPGADAVLTKPFEPDELLGLVANLIEGER